VLLPDSGSELSAAASSSVESWVGLRGVPGLPGGLLGVITPLLLLLLLLPPLSVASGRDLESPGALPSSVMGSRWALNGGA